MIKKVITGLGLALFVVLGSLFIATEAEALADPLGRVRTYQVTCGTTPIKLSPTSGFYPVSAFKVKVGATAVFLGGSDVDASTKGFPYSAGEVETIDAAPGVVWCVTASGTSTMTVFGGTKG